MPARTLDRLAPIARLARLALAGWIALTAPIGASAFALDETLDGDLSGDRLAPTRLVLAPGANDLAMTSGSPSGSVDRDYFTFFVPAGWVLDSIFLLSAQVDGAVSFIGLQSGPVFSEPPVGANVGNLLGWHHFGGSEAGTEILDDIATGAGSQGFIPPLPTGHYTFWAQDFGFQAAYAMRFQVSPLPEPELGAALASGLAGLGLLGRRRARGDRAGGA
ncbi:MAG: hypothetical protein U0900_01090 [Myxococcota bacterium]